LAPGVCSPSADPGGSTPEELPQLLGESRAVCAGCKRRRIVGSGSNAPCSVELSTGVDNSGDNRGVAVSGRARCWIAESNSAGFAVERADGEGDAWYTFHNMTSGFRVSERY
jgi:hypothetical protein